jgi:phosphoglycerate dehydrogenase-like enzyme
VIDAGKLALMKSDAVLINTSRGEIVNRRSSRRLKAGKLGGAASTFSTASRWLGRRWRDPLIC